MCGIVGVIQKNNYGLFGAQEDVFFQMLYADALRGPDSTGTIAVERHGNFHIAKEATEATWLIPQVKATDFFKEKMSATKPTGKAWIGHNRKTTVGKTTDENAHPFVVNDEFAFVHNGTLHNHEKLAKVNVDSEALAIVIHEAMGKENWKEAIEETLGQVSGAYACSWYDARHGKVFLLRNSQRPLSIIETNAAYYWASEGGMAWWILGRNNIKAEEMKVFALGEHHLVSFDLEKTTMEVTELTPKKATAPATTRTQGAGARTHAVTGNSRGGKEGTEDDSAHWTKSQRKNFRHAWVGRVVRFWADDFVELDYPDKTLDKGASDVWLFGEHEEISIPHTLRTQIDLGKLGLRYKEDIVDRLWRGTVGQVDFDKKTGHITLWVDACKPVVSSLVTKLKADKLPPWEDQPAKPPFPKNPYTNAANDVKNATMERVSMMKKHYEESFGELDEVVTKDGKVRLVVKDGDKKGQIVYETAIAIH